MDTYKETFETWNNVASLYQEKFMNLDFYNETYDFICNTITKVGAELLEIGCGPGNISKYLLSMRPDFKINGIDIAPMMVELATENNPTASFTVMDCREISTMKSKFDGIICGFCLPYLSLADVSKLIPDAYDLLLGQGLLYLSFVEGEPGKSGFKSASSGDRAYVYYHKIETINKLLADNNFEKPTVFKVDYEKDKDNKELHAILITRKKMIA